MAGEPVAAPKLSIALVADRINDDKPDVVVVVVVDDCGAIAVDVVLALTGC